MKQKRLIFPLIIAVAGLMVLLVIVSAIGDDTDAIEKPVDSVTLIKDFDQVTSIQIRAGQKIELAKTEGSWLVQNADREQNNKKVSDFINTMKELRGEEVEGGKKATNFRAQEAAVVFEDTDGTEQQLSIGKINSNGDKYFVHHIENDKIYLVERKDIEMIPIQSTMLLNNTILTAVPAEVNEIFIDNGTEKIHLTKESPYSKQEALAHISGWYVKEPYHSVYSVAFSKMESILAGMEQLQKNEIINDESLLGEVDFRITFQTDGHSETLLIGDPAPNQHYYAQLAGSEEVFTIPARALDPYSYPSFAIIDQFVHIVPLEVVQLLEVDSAEYKWTITRFSDSGENGVKNTLFSVNQKKIAMESLQEAYKGLAGLSINKMIEAENNLSKNKELSITYYTGTKHVIDFYSVDENYFAYEKNGEGFDFTIEKEKVYDALEKMKSILPE
ncbi:DUF4340 domain-containing protein [Gracilibacillus xinjiangensis]|uniref:DUF4340 domain-containing protein n=1 Tax=Gracilibacillus xinjiangensis TaxID=1193282 RepID=A0ABV8WRU5_9BACI